MYTNKIKNVYTYFQVHILQVCVYLVSILDELCLPSNIVCYKTVIVIFVHIIKNICD